MSLLELSWDDLRQKIENEICSNPALEVVEAIICPTCHKKMRKPGLCPVCSRPDPDNQGAPIVFVSTRREFNPVSSWENEEILDKDEWSKKTDDLPTHIMRQIASELKPEERTIAAHILTCLNEDGLLDVPPIEIAQYHHIPLSRIQRVIRLVQKADPLGTGSSTPQEALVIQLEVLAEIQPIPRLAQRLVKEDMELLSRRAFQELCKKYHCSTDEIQTTFRFITKNLNPYPGRTNWSGSVQVESNPAYTQPDIIVTLMKDVPGQPLMVEVLSPYSGGLRVNPLFRSVISQAPEDKVEEWQASLEAASLLVKCLQQRNQALVRLMQKIVVYQRQFILHGEAYLQPITRAQISQELEVHESTISRAVAGKSVLLPNKKIIPLSKMFDRSLHIRTALKELIENESQPLSDTQLAGLLEKRGFPVARRTVAKYRAMEGILSARYRTSAFHSR
jgi:RNA polymerase sigma-54 factor